MNIIKNVNSSSIEESKSFLEGNLRSAMKQILFYSKQPVELCKVANLRSNTGSLW